MPPACVCPKLCMPPAMCGSNGKTYCDVCHLRCAQSKDPSLTVKHVGDCDDRVSFTGNLHCIFIIGKC